MPRIMIASCCCPRSVWRECMSLRCKSFLTRCWPASSMLFYLESQYHVCSASAGATTEVSVWEQQWHGIVAGPALPRQQSRRQLRAGQQQASSNLSSAGAAEAAAGGPARRLQRSWECRWRWSKQRCVPLSRRMGVRNCVGLGLAG